jgi:sialic acid synthase SpsE
MTKIISEIGWNHMGDMDLAKLMISESVNNGADMVKLQTWSVDRLKDGPWDTDGRREIYEKAELTMDKHFELLNWCDDLSVPFFTSVFSVEDAELLYEVQTERVKIASFESRNKELLSYCDNNFDTIYISTGTSTVDEIKESLKYIKTSNVVLLHCVSSYPLEYANANLPRINSLKKLCDRVGYSDHTSGIEGSKVALEYDIEVIEKHFTTDKRLPGRDNKFSILPHELRELSDYIKLRREMNVNHGDGYLECEEEAREVMTERFDG